MPKEPRDANGTREGNSPSRVQFYDPKGSDIGSRFVSGSETKTEKTQKPSTEANVAAPPDVPEIIDEDHAALNERINNHAAESIQQHAEELGEALQAKFLHILKKKAAEMSSPLSDEEIAEMGAEFRAEMTAIETMFVKAVEDYTRAREQTRQEQSRTQLFHRLLVHNFAHRFADDAELHDHPEKLSRRMLPGFFSMLQLMLGERRLARFEQDARKVVEGQRSENDGTIDWERVYRSADARKLCFRAEVEIARYFTETEKRLNWMVAVINANLIPADTKIQAGEWTMSTRAAELMLSALIRNLRATLTNDNAKSKMERKLGRDTVTLLDVIARRFG